MTTANTFDVNEKGLIDLRKANQNAKDLLDSIELENKLKLESFTSALDSKNVKYEVEGNRIGIMLTPFCWTWIDIVGSMAFFSHTYSQNTGETKKSLDHRTKKIAHLKRLGITL